MCQAGQRRLRLHRRCHNALTLRTDLVEAGIIDPTKVVRLALENAVSAAGVLLLTEATMTEVAEPKATETPSLEAA